MLALAVYTMPITSANCMIEDDDQILLVVDTKDGGLGEPLRPRTPVQVPVVSQSGHTLYLYSGCDNTTIELLDVNGQVVYTTDVAEGTETLTLPASLTGTFELRIIRGSFTFVGEIDL